jgi:hypothetical protein
MPPAQLVGSKFLAFDRALRLALEMLDDAPGTPAPQAPLAPYPTHVTAPILHLRGKPVQHLPSRTAA